MRTWMCWLAVSGLLAASLGGCDRPATDRQSQSVLGAVAIIDLDAVAQTLGRDKQMSESFQKHQTEVNQQLATIKVSYEQELSKRKSEVGENPSPKQVQRLSSLNQQANTSFGQVRQQAKRNLAQHRTELIQQFRAEVRPIARQVAAEKGLSIIVTKNESVIFDFASAVDITDEVIQRMRSRQPELRQQGTTPYGGI